VIWLANITGNPAVGVAVADNPLLVGCASATGPVATPRLIRFSLPCALSSNVLSLLVWRVSGRSSYRGGQPRRRRADAPEVVADESANLTDIETP
jgi:hypothetical protein